MKIISSLQKQYLNDKTKPPRWHISGGRVIKNQEMGKLINSYHITPPIKDEWSMKDYEKDLPKG